MRRDLPAGTVTFLFTDVEGSTRLLHELGSEGYAEALAEHRRVLREAFSRHGGVEVDTQGDAFFVAFPTAPGALAAAAEARAALAIPVRMGIHTGTPFLAEEGYVGPDVNRAARIAACGHGRQVLVSASTASLIGADGLVDLGEHRLKDLSAPERIFQLGDGEFPPLQSLHQTNLPIPATPFLGRERELGEIGELLGRGDARLVTLTGPGGTGKTRLALHAAGAAADAFPAGVWWVPLAPLRDPALVLETAAHALGAKDGLAAHIADRQILLLLDNFEHVVEAAGELSALLAACPRLRLLVTSRELLQLPGEQAYPVPPLEPAEGTELFLARARAARPDFHGDGAVEQLCARLDQLPLAIELAAARVRMLSPEALLERLSQRLDLLKAGRGVDPRQQTLRATIEWSYELLTAEEQQLFARLAVFRGGCTLEAAEHVCDADLDTLQSLVDKSLVRVREGERFWMLETIREYAAERLAEAGETASVRDRHLGFYVELAEGWYEPARAGATRLPELDAEQDNLRAALDWAQTADPRKEAQLAGAVAHHWFVRGFALEARERLEGALSRHLEEDRLRARALMHMGQLAMLVPARGGGASHDLRGEGLAYLRSAQDLFLEHDDELGAARALELIGAVQTALGEHEAARESLEGSLASLRRASAPETEIASALSSLCQLLVAMGEIEQVEPRAKELWEVGERLGATATQEVALHFLADCPLIAGDFEEAERRYARALAFARDAGMRTQCANELLGVAMSAGGRGDARRAVRLASAAYEERERLGLTRRSPMAFWAELQERFIGAARAALAPAELEEEERAGSETPFEEVLDDVLGSAGERAR